VFGALAAATIIVERRRHGALQGIMSPTDAS